MSYREESDTLGPVRIPADAPWGPQTQRALGNTIHVDRLPDGIWRALLQVKEAAATVNGRLGLVEGEVADAIGAAARAVLEDYDPAAFPLSPYMTGSGTSANMNVNEVLAHRANGRLGADPYGKSPVHPNDHVNRCQSSNDVFPTAVHLAAVDALHAVALPGLTALAEALEEKAGAFHEILKLGRTHLMDALPVRLGAEFGAYARQVRLGMARVEAGAGELREVPLGGTAVGTGVNAHPDFAEGVLALLNETPHRNLRVATNRFEATGARDGCVAASGALRTVAVSLVKIANDLRWLGSGPGGGLGEVRLPAVQPGSSIMPGKVNPVICEAVLQAMTQVLGLDAALAVAGTGGVLELQLMMPLMGANLLKMIALVGEGADLLARRCIAGIAADPAACARHLETSFALVTPLAAAIGYDKAAEAVKKAYAEGTTLRAALLALGVGEGEALDRLLDPRTMV